MRQLEDQQIREIQLKILDSVARYCEDNKLVYFLCGGTLLGAIRHRGYIPWDDDIDLMMPRKYYNILINTFRCNGLKLYSYHSVPNYNKPFIKIADTKTELIESAINKYKIGVNIDIFPIDGFPNDSELISKHLKKISLYRSLLGFKTWKRIKGSANKNEWLVSLSKLPLFFFSNRKLVQKINSLSQKYDFESSEKAGISVWGYGKKEVCPKSVFLNSIDVEFENKLYKAPLEYKIYLSHVYGKFMELPPIEQQVTHHDYMVLG